jgi:hypothetical protein
MKHSYKTKSQRKCQEGHLEEDKTAKLAKGTKSDKLKKMTILTKIKTPPETNSP